MSEVHPDRRAILRLVGAFVLLSLVPLGLLAYTSIDVSEDAVRREVAAHLATAARVTSTVLDREAESLAELVQSYALRPGLAAGVASGDPARFDAGTVDFHLQQLAGGRPGISGAFLTDVGGRITNVVPSTPDIVGDDFSHQDWYRGLTESQSPYVSEAYVAAIDGRPLAVAAAAYVRSPATGEAPRQSLAILVLVYRLDAMQKFGREVSPLKGVEVTITDQRGTLLAGPDPPRPSLVSKRDDLAVAAALSGQSGVARVEAPGGSLLVAYAPAPGTGWTVSASTPERRALAGIARLRGRVLTIAGVLALGLMGGLGQLLRVQRRRLAAEATLRDSEARTRAILDGAHDGFFSVGPDRLITAWNPRAAEMLGWSAEEALGLPLGARLLPAGTASPDERVLAQFLAGGTPVGGAEALHRSLEVTLVTRSGDEVPLEVALFASPTGDGSWHAFLRDLRERTRAQEALAQLAAIVHGSDDAVIGVSLGGDITTWNPGAESLYGYSAEEAVGRPISMLVPPGEGDEITAIVGRFYRGEAVGQYETIQVRADGTVIDVSVTASPIRDAAGNIVGISKIARDISRRKQVETELESARDAAIEASRHKSEFLANMSHEIRTPMNGVLGMTSLLLGTDLDPEQRDYAETAHRSGEALLGVINDILDFSKVEAGRLEFEHVDFDLRLVVEDSTHALARAAEEKALELACLVPPDLPTQLRGDPARLRQVLTNLLSNAIKFTGVGEVVVRVGLVEEGPTDVLVGIEVSDTGIGIPSDYVDHLFDAFSQADASTTRRFGGTGLGLAISRRLVELMGGTISVVSVPGQGSTFRFTARFDKVADGHVPAPRQPRHDLVGLRVLVVDDHATNRAILTQMLVAWSMRPAEAVGGRDALEVLQRAAAAGRPFEVVVLDRNMPDLDGLEVVRRMHEDPVLAAATRIVLLTSSADRADAKRAGALKVAGYLTKPVRQSQLYDCLAMVMGDASATAPMASPSRLSGARAAAGLRLLLVEDNPVNRKVAVRSLEKMGYAVDVAENGAEALSSASRGRYAAILMDCQMPVMDGYEATGAIRRSEQARGGRTPIIAMTASAMEGDRERCLAAGMDDYLSKPLRADAVAAVLARWVEVAPPAQPRPAVEDPSGGELDPQILANLVEMDEQSGFTLLDEVVQLLQRDTPPRLAQMQEAVQTGDYAGLKEAAHALRGSAATVGATAMAAITWQLEEMGRSGRLDGAAELLAELTAAVPKVIEAVGRARPGSAPS